MVSGYNYPNFLTVLQEGYSSRTVRAMRWRNVAAAPEG
jgi:hypothetical protein